MKDTNISYDVVRDNRLMPESKIIILVQQVFLSDFFGKIVDEAFHYKFRISGERKCQKSFSSYLVYG